MKGNKMSMKKKTPEIDPVFIELFIESLDDKTSEDENLPSTIKSKTYIHAHYENGSYPATTSRSGKWCVFVRRQEHDEWWGKIKSACLMGKLGEEIKTSTGIRISRSPYKDKAVVIVYTYDYEDKEDVLRIRKELRAIGVTWKIAYKADKESKARKYYSKGSDRVGIYYE
jgi:hypothetical protein